MWLAGLATLLALLAAVHFARTASWRTGVTPMGFFDRLWMDLDEADGNVVVINAVMFLEGRTTRQKLWALCRERLLPFMQMRAVAKRGKWRTVPIRDMDTDYHVQEVTLDDESDETMRAFVDSVMYLELDKNQPLWMMYIVHRGEGDDALLVRIHHSVGDGVSLVAAMLQFTSVDEAGTTPSSVPARKSRNHGVERRGVWASLAALLRDVYRLLFAPWDTRTSLKCTRVGTRKRGAWSAPLDFARVKATGHALGVTLNDVLLSVVAGALRDYLVAKGDDVDTIESLMGVIPFNLRDPSLQVTELKNDLSLLYCPFPVQEDDNVKRTELAHRAMDDIKHSWCPLVNYGAMLLLSFWPLELIAKPIFTFLGSKSTLIYTNVPGPMDMVFVAGTRMKRMVFFVPQNGVIGLGVSVFSYGGQVTVGVAMDAGLGDPNEIAKHVQPRFEALADHCGV